jgi:ABC-type nitrate/sulfonate/bicarbonate transport system ATPase subunit
MDEDMAVALAVQSTTAPPAVRMERVGHRYGTLETLRDVTFEVDPGEALGIVGQSGCGKSTLLSLIAGLEAPSAGAVVAEPAALMPQKDLLMPWRSALDNACIALQNRGLRRAEARARAWTLFAALGLERFAQAHTWELSGGIRQRVAFVRTLLAETPVLLLDEPFGALDQITRGELQDWLCEALAAEPRTLVLVTHDVEEALVVCDRVLALPPRPGSVVHEEPGRLARSSARLAEARGRLLEALR